MFKMRHIPFQSPLVCNVFLLKCLRNNCTLEYSGEEHSIHFLSTMTCAGDEIGWGFVSLVKSSKLSFTSFCDEMTRKYKTNKILSPLEYKDICALAGFLDGMYEN